MTKSKSLKSLKSKSKKQSILNLNTFLNNDNTTKKSKKNKSKKSKKQSHHKKHSKTYIPKLINISLNSLEKQFNLELYKDTITSFYALNNPIISYLVKYDDTESKRLIKNGFYNLELVPAYKFPEIEDTLKTIDLTFKLHQDLLKELKLKDIPKIVKYASEDFTRGIRGFLDSRFKDLPINLSNGFVKLWEILHMFKLMDTTKQNMNVFHIAEAPGQMVMCAKYYAEKKHPNITNYEWRANSLNPYNYDSKTKFAGLRDDYRLIKTNPQKWLWGSDNTGDITRVNNIKSFKKYIDTKWLKKQDTKEIKETPHLDLIIGDGGLSADTNPAYILQKLDLAQVITVVSCSSIGGSCVIKHFTSYMINKPETLEATSFFISFMYLYYIAFEEVNLFKPYTSDATSGEFYVICKGFKGIYEKQLEKLYTILNKFKTNYAIFPKEAIPEPFIKQMYNFLDVLTKYNIKGYEKQNYLLNCYKEANTKENYMCKTFMNEKNIENILIPRYNQWIKMNEFE
jgi:hypothetical protein